MIFQLGSLGARKVASPFTVCDVVLILIYAFPLTSKAMQFTQLAFLPVHLPMTLGCERQSSANKRGLVRILFRSFALSDATTTMSVQVGLGAEVPSDVGLFVAIGDN